MTIDDAILSTILETSDNIEYTPPKITVEEFKLLVEKATCGKSKDSTFVASGYNTIILRILETDCIGDEIPSEFAIAYVKVGDSYKAFLQTLDRGPEYVWDEQRFIPSSQIIDMLRFMGEQCAE